MTRLAPVLSERDLPLPELTAARLDGEVVALEHCFSPIDEVIGRSHRALALRAVLDERLIVELLTAAWLWGAAPHPGTPLRSCVATGTGIRVRSTVWNTVREMSLTPEDITVVNGVRATTPWRTIIDLARDTGMSDERATALIADLAPIGAITLTDFEHVVDRIRRLPGGRRALVRMREALSPS